MISTQVADYLRGEGGEASSRNVGRHLAAKGLLRPLKARYAGLFHFLQQRSDVFTIELPTKKGELEYRVLLASWAARKQQQQGGDQEYPPSVNDGESQMR